MEIIVQFLGLGIFIIGGILFFIEAFKTTLLWGLGCIFLTPVTIFYLVSIGVMRKNHLLSN